MIAAEYDYGTERCLSIVVYVDWRGASPNYDKIEHRQAGEVKGHRHILLSLLVCFFHM